MPPERTKELVDQLRTWYMAGETRQKDLAATLGLRPQQLAEILALRNRPTGEQVMRIIAFLNEETMKDPNEPRTLHQAKEMIADLQAQLKSTPPAPAAPAPIPPEAATRPTPPPSSPTPKPAVQLPTASTAPATDIMSIVELRDALAKEKDTEVQFALYKQVKRLDQEAAAARQLATKNRLLAHKGQPLAIAPQPPTTSRDPNLGAPPIEASPPFPESADAPVPIQAILDQMSVGQLKEQLAGKLDPLRLTMTYQELKRRQQLVNY